MSSTSTTNSLALHEIILSIADSLNEAQETLRSMPPYDEYGRPNTLYQLPYLDFNLEVISQFESTETSGGGGALPARSIRFLPFRSTETTTTNQNIVTSTISGRFVAVMPNEGLPQVFLECSAEPDPITSGDGFTGYRITIRAVNAANEAVIGQRIEVNFNTFSSRGFNSGEDVNTPIFTGAKDGYTDENGRFEVSVKLDNVDYDFGKTFIFAANSGTQFSSIAISKP
ncbi:hypothetical protein [Fluviicola sp.]|uniref:hypothetical protein n=1 Tax=Fluviicola sp. TaxID=1917219 RepID=UPI0031E02499